MSRQNYRNRITVYSACAILFIGMFASCQYTSNPKKFLLNPETRKETMEIITNSNAMMNEMMEAILNNNNSKLVMQRNDKMIVMMLENRDTMMKVMKDNPVMMQYMMADMMEVCKSDSAMMDKMHKTMMDNPQMMNMMQHGNKEKQDINKMEGMQRKM